MRAVTAAISLVSALIAIAATAFGSTSQAMTPAAPAFAAAIATSPEPEATSSTRRPRTVSGWSSRYRASAWPPAQGNAQNGGASRSVRSHGTNGTAAQLVPDRTSASGVIPRAYGDSAGSARGLPCGVEREAVEDEPAVADLAAGDGDALGAGRALDRYGLGVVHDHRGLGVSEGGDQPGAGEHLHERAHEAPVGDRALKAAGRGVADDVVRDVAHGLVQVVTGPGVKVGQRDLECGAAGVGHVDLLFRRGRSTRLCRHRAGRERNAAGESRQKMAC